MGRPEKPVNCSVPELGHFAEALRAMRHAAGLTYRELAEHTNYSAAQLRRAASGERLPRIEVVRQYVKACLPYLDDDAKRRTFEMEVPSWYGMAAAAVAHAAELSRRSTIVPKPEYVRDEADLSGAMRDAWSRAGRLPSRSIESLSDKQVPRSTAHAICKGRAVPRDLRQFVSFLHVCEIDGAALKPWFRAWFKVFGRPSEKAVADALRFLSSTEEKQAFLDLYVGSSVSPERSRKELGLIADFIAQFNDREHEAAASRRVLIDRQITNTRYLGGGKTHSMPEALLACLEVETTLEGGSASPMLERLRKPVTSLRERRWHDNLRRSGLRL
ncbi:helix-turn-helix domain-containing protein [Streptomyces sp. NPDC003642]